MRSVRLKEKSGAEMNPRWSHFHVHRMEKMAPLKQGGTVFSNKFYYGAILAQLFFSVEMKSIPLSRSYVIKTQHKNNAMLIPNLTC